jgi:eukaryotic-like serine/threonine-protein kinase
MAELFLAKDPQHKRMVVLKRILPYLAEDPEFVKMFLDEARIAAQLHHPNCVEILELGQLDKALFIVMEWIDGVDLRRFILREKERGRLIPPAVAAQIVAKLCEGLHYAHQRLGPKGKPLGIVHRDVSPQNVMVSFQGAVKLVDFGIAKANVLATKSQPGVIKGKYLYLSPEQVVQQPLDGRSDLFSVGTLLYEMTCGENPFQRASAEAVLVAVRNSAVPPPVSKVRGYPAALSKIILRCLEKSRSARYASCDEARLALLDFVESQKNRARRLDDYIDEVFGSSEERTAINVPGNTGDTDAKAQRTVSGEGNIASLATPMGQPLSTDTQEPETLTTTGPVRLPQSASELTSVSLESIPATNVTEDTDLKTSRDLTLQPAEVRREQLSSAVTQKAAKPSHPPPLKVSSKKRAAPALPSQVGLSGDPDDFVATQDAKMPSALLKAVSRRPPPKTPARTPLLPFALFGLLAALGLSALVWALWPMPRSAPLSRNAAAPLIRVRLKTMKGAVLQWQDKVIDDEVTVDLPVGKARVSVGCGTAPKRFRLVEFEVRSSETAQTVELGCP